MKKMSKLFAAVLMSLAAFGSAQAMDLTVFEGNETSRTSPINIYWYDTSGTQSQVIFPESALTDMVGCPINSIKFYLDRNISVSAEGAIRISLGISEQESFTSNTFITDGLTQVATYTIPTDVNELEITFDEPFVYNGGNLVFDAYVVTKGAEITGFFYGVDPGYNSAKSRSQLEKFLPKTTFDYTPQENKAVVTPQELNFGNVSKGGEATKVITLKNAGLNAFTPVFSTLAAPFSTNAQPVELASGESMEIPVTLNTDNAGTFTQDFTIDCGAAGMITVPISAAVVLEVVAADGTKTNNNIPVIILNYNEEETNYTQMIYPANMLTALNGKKVNSLKFHTNVPMTKIAGGKVKVSLKEVDFTEFVDVAVTEMTVVAEVTPVFDETGMSITFDNPFEYNGGNLAVEVYVTEPGEYNYSGNGSFVGIETDYYASCYYDYYWESMYAQEFLPKATFGYVDEVAPQPEWELGDVNHDGKVTIADVTALIDYLLSDSANAPVEANVNGDDKVTIADVTALIDMLLSGAAD